MAGKFDTDSRRRGAALFVVLTFAALLSGLLAVAMRSSMSGARAAALFSDVMQADQLGRATADLVADYVANGEPERRRGGRFSVHLPGLEIAVDYVSESARVDANAAPPALIAALLSAAGAEPAQSRAIGERIARFRSRSVQGRPAAAASLVEAAGSPASGRNAPATPTGTGAGSAQLEDAGNAALPGESVPLIQHTDEIAEAWGLPADLARRILPGLTVSSRSDKVDPILADRLVLTALLGDPTRVDDYIERRGQGFASTAAALDLLPVSARGFARFTDAAAVRATARVSVGRRFERRYETVLEPAKHPGDPPSVFSWRPLT